MNETKPSQILTLLKIVLGSGFVIVLLLTVGIFTVNQSDITLGDYGGYIAGLMGTGISFLTVVLVYKTYTLQEEELRETRKQLQRQQFETNFFNIMNMLKSVTNELTLKYIHFDRRVNSSIEYFKGLDAFKHVSDSLKYYHYVETSIVKGFIGRRIYAKYSDEFDFNQEEADNKKIDDKIIEWVNKSSSNEEFYITSLYDIINMDINGSLDPFFHTIKFLLEELKQVENSNFYIRLIQSQLSKYQLIVLFYQGLIKTDLKDLLDQYKLLENIDEDLLIGRLDLRFYPNTEFKHSYYRLIQTAKKLMPPNMT